MKALVVPMCVTELMSAEEVVERPAMSKPSPAKPSLYLGDFCILCRHPSPGSVCRLTVRRFIIMQRVKTHGKCTLGGFQATQGGLCGRWKAILGRAEAFVGKGRGRRAFLASMYTLAGLFTCISRSLCMHEKVSFRH